MPNPIPSKCEYCDKRGVPILPLRHGVVPSDAATPATTDSNVALPAQAAKYVLRLLRAGYLYVYDEARNSWASYYVTGESFFIRLTETPGVSPVLPKKPFDCPDEGHRALASCITIPDAKRATKVWLGFSDVLWTEATLKLHSDATHRKRHMRCVVVNSFATSPDAKHCLGINELGAKIAEYAVEPAALKTALRSSPFATNPRKERFPRLRAECEQLAPGKGFAVALEDPAGAAQELAALIQDRLNAFVSDTRTDRDRPRKLAVSAAIMNLSSAVGNQAELDEIEAASGLQRQAESDAGAALIFGSVRRQVEEIGNVSPADLDRARDHAWTKYSEKYDERARRDWQRAYDAQLETLKSSSLEPLAQAHAMWMTSKAMQAMMECNFDKHDPRTGAIYTAVTQACVRGTAGLQHCFDLYKNWLSRGDALDPANILYRALVYNNDGIAEAAKTATDIDKRIVPWDNVYGLYKAVVEKMESGKADDIAKLLHEMTGPIAKVAAETLDGPAKLIIGLLSLHYGKQWLKVSIQGSRKDFRRLLVKTVVESGDGYLNPRQVQVAVDREIRRLEIRGDKLEGKRGAKWIVMLDRERIAGMPAAAPAVQAQWLEGHLQTPAQLDELRISTWRNVANAGVRMGIISGILQIACFTKVMEDDANSLAADKSESHGRLLAGALAITGTICEIGEKSLGKLPSFVSAAAEGLRWASLPKYLGVASKALGAIGGAIMAGWDFYKAFESAKKGDGAVATLYFGSGVLGAVVTVGFLFSWNPLLMIVLVGIFVLVAVLLEHYKDNKLQSWLDQCIFSKHEHYPNGELEMKEFALAVK